jgi:hypothetical protein
MTYTSIPLLLTIVKPVLVAALYLVKKLLIIHYAASTQNQQLFNADGSALITVVAGMHPAKTTSISQTSIPTLQQKEKPPLISNAPINSAF